MLRIVELECENCGASLKHMHGKHYKCEHCGARFVLDNSEEKPVLQPKRNQSSKGGVAALFALCLVYLFIVILCVLNSKKEEPKTTPKMTAYEQEVAKSKINSLYFIEFIQVVFHETPYTVTDEQLGSIKYMHIRDTMDSSFVDYRINDEEMKTVEITSAKTNRTRDLNFFWGLEVLDVNSINLSEYDIGKLEHLCALTCGNTPEELAGILYDPGAITELHLTYNEDTLESLPMFGNLMTLDLNAYNLTSIEQLIYAPQLKSLRLKCDDVTEYSTLRQMHNLESLSLYGENIKDISCITELDKLTTLNLERTSLCSTSFLAEMTNLKCLYFGYNTEIKDYTVIGNLVNLEELTFSNPSDATMPNIAALTKLKSLTISGDIDESVLNKCTKLEYLSLSSYSSIDVNQISNLTNLESLKLNCGIASEISHLSTLTSFNKLTKLDISNCDVLSDGSEIFNIPSLEELNLSETTLGFTPSLVKDNTSLKKLDLSKVRFVTNIEVYHSGFVTSVDYDTLELTEWIGLLDHFANIEELKIQGCKLENLNFTKNMPNLKTLDITDNYITELSLLDFNTQLEKVTCTNNPIEDQDFSKKAYEVIY